MQGHFFPAHPEQFNHQLLKCNFPTTNPEAEGLLQTQAHHSAPPPGIGYVTAMLENTGTVDMVTLLFVSNFYEQHQHQAGKPHKTK